VLRFWRRGKLKRGAQEKAEALYWKENSYKADWPQENKKEMEKLAAEVLNRFPKMKVASDQSHRLYDLAIDFAEEVSPPLSFEEAERVKDYCEERGYTAKVSSIHVNTWRGDFSKFSGLQFLLENIYQKSVDKNLVYVGDSPNDAPLFEKASVSVGVANLKGFVGKVKFQLPRFIAKGKSAEGSCEVIGKLLARRSAR
jgi:hydroxymethylpyrimidine pyrophosphatase-like HAD family hydrolase